MIAVVIFAMLFAALRTEGSRGVGLAMILVCVFVLTIERTHVAVAARRAQGLRTGPAMSLGIVSTSAVVAAALIGLSDLAFLAGHFGYRFVMDEYIWVHSERGAFDAYYPDVVGSSLGVAFAVWVASFLRKTIWPIRVDRREAGRPPSQ